MLLLASTSPFRAALLRSAGVAFEICASDIEETDDPAIAPRAQALSFARQKAAALSSRFPSALVLGADQTLELDGRLLRKPNTRAEARAQLSALAGKTHTLHSAIALFRQLPRVRRSAITSIHLRMRSLSPRAIEAYLDTGEWQGCAGSYRVESQGLNLFESIRGDYHAIIGLPMLKLLRLLRNLGEGPFGT
ncbi:MAG: Maf family protein [Myxococcales bacterium]|jgi:septum formation protein|nr:Maf family protein [Myxococcales bacterium]